MKRVNEEDRYTKKIYKNTEIPYRVLRWRDLLEMQAVLIYFTKFDPKSKEILPLCDAILNLQSDYERALYHKARIVNSIELYENYINRGSEFKVVHIYHNLAICYGKKKNFKNAMKYYELCMLHGLGCSFKPCVRFWDLLAMHKDPRAPMYLERCIQIADLEPRKIAKSKKLFRMFMYVLLKHDSERVLQITNILASPFQHLTMLSNDAYVNWNILTKVHQSTVGRQIKENLRQYGRMKAVILKSCNTNLEDPILNIILDFLFRM